MCCSSGLTKMTVLLTVLAQLDRKTTEATKMIKYNYVYCHQLDDEIFEVQHCQLKVTSRINKTFQIQWVLKKDIVESVWHLRFMKRSNTWRTFFVDDKIEVCDFLRNPRKYFIQKLFFDLVKQYVNFNHKCPYKAGEVLYIDLPTLDEKKFSNLLQVLPVSSGIYGIFINLYVNGTKRASVNGSLTYTDDV